MEFKFAKHVKIVCSLEVGDKVKIYGWGPRFDTKILEIEDIKLQPHIESGVGVKVKGYDGYLSSNWITKID